MRLLKNQNFVGGILVVVCVFQLCLVHSVRGQPYYDAWFTHIYVTDGNGEVDLINGGTARVYDGQEAVKRLVLYNSGCGTFGADLYTRIYRNDELVWTSGETYVSKGSSDVDSFSAILSPATYSYKVELWWENWGDHLLVDVKQFEVKVVKLAISNWASPMLTVERHFQTESLTLTFANGGNDPMYDVGVSLTDSAGLTVTPQTQGLGTINEGQTASTTFSVWASRDVLPKNYTITLEVSYNDWRAISHQETFQVDVNVTSKFSMLITLFWALIITVIIAVSLTSLAYVKMRKPQQIKTSKS